MGLFSKSSSSSSTNITDNRIAVEGGGLAASGGSVISITNADPASVVAPALEMAERITAGVVSSSRAAIDATVQQTGQAVEALAATRSASSADRLGLLALFALFILFRR